MVNDLKRELSFSVWYPRFTKDSLEAVVLPIPDKVLKYLEHDAFVLPLEAAKSVPYSSEWSDGSPVNQESAEDSERQPTFPDFSKQIQEVLDKYGAVFIKCNWSTPSDATWVAPTKTLKCTTLEEVYLLLKSSDRILGDLTGIMKSNDNRHCLEPCLVLKRWRDINPCTEFRCFVVKNELIGISQRDLSQCYSYIEAEKYGIQQDIKSIFMERIKHRFNAENYVIDMIRYKKDKVKIIDFGPLDESVTKGTLFTYEELNSELRETPEFRFIAEDMGIQPNATRHFCVPQEINEFLQSAGNMSMMDIIQEEVNNQHQSDNDDNF